MEHYSPLGYASSFLRLYSDYSVPSRPALPISAPAVAAPTPIETEEEKEDREFLAEVKAEMELEFEQEEKAREEKLQKVRGRKEAVKKEHEASVNRVKRVEKSNQLVRELHAQRHAEWDKGQKQLEAEEQELAEAKEKYRVQTAVEQGLARERGGGPVKGPTPVEWIHVRLWQKPAEVKVEDQGEGEESDGDGKEKEMEKLKGDEGTSSANSSSGPQVNAAPKSADASIQRAATSRLLPTKPTSPRKRKAASSSADLPIEEEGKVTRRGRAY